MAFSQLFKVQLGLLPKRLVEANGIEKRKQDSWKRRLAPVARREAGGFRITTAESREDGAPAEPRSQELLIQKGSAGASPSLNSD